MNFITEFKKGQESKNKGFYMGDGLANISKTINGVQKHRIFGISSAAKVGKSTFTDYGFVIQPYLDACSTYSLPNVDWVYFSFEIDRVSKEFDFATYFLFNDYGIEAVSLPEGITKNGESSIPLSPDYLRGRLLDDNNEVILIKENILTALKEVYNSRIIPLFGEYSEDGVLLQKGKITFIEQKDNPTGIYKCLLSKAEKEGHFVYRTYGDNKRRITGYVPDNEDKTTIVVIDHMRKASLERGHTMKQNVDKLAEYCVELRNLCSYTFCLIIHTNRNIVDTDRLKFAKDEIYPMAEDVKDTSNISEDCDYMFTMMNPNDEKYHLQRHFGMTIKDKNGNPLYPNLRTVHLVESRHVSYPQHFKTVMEGNLKSFKSFS